MKKIFFIATIPEFFISHRLKLALAARKMGLDVHVVTSNGCLVEKIKALGFQHHVIPFSRSGQHPLKEFLTLLSLYKLLIQERPEIVHLIGTKCSIYGGILAQILKLKGVVVAITGLGTVFLSQTFFGRIRKKIILLAYGIIFRHNNIAVIFQNKDDINELIKIKSLKCSKVNFIRGAGVDLTHFRYDEAEPGIPVVVYAARLIKDKGVFEFVDAARILKKRGISVVMRLIGSLDPENLSSIRADLIESWRAEAVVEIFGFSTDIAKEYRSAHIVCLPSYREGLPLGLIEAASCGRAVVTTDVPGCREVIIPNETGLLVPVKDATKLADAIQELVLNPRRREQFGKAGRKMAELEYSDEKIVDQVQEIYCRLLQKCV
ncbi:glycosyltransferase family 4 protein [Amylibacter sp.]|nr:glycosyltransferase family 4 protein [Amylibacter sp.]